MDGAQCIARMDKLQHAYLDSVQDFYFCESTADFTLEETAALVGQALGNAAGAEVVMVPIGEFHEGSEVLKAGVGSKLYAGKINADVSTTICPVLDGEYAIMTMNGAQIKELAEAGFDADGNGNPYPYLVVTHGTSELYDNITYQVAFFMQGYTEETAQAYSAEVYKGSIREFLHDYLSEWKETAPGQTFWK